MKVRVTLHHEKPQFPAISIETDAYRHDGLLMLGDPIEEFSPQRTGRIVAKRFCEMIGMPVASIGDDIIMLGTEVLFHFEVEPI